VIFPWVVFVESMVFSIITVLFGVPIAFYRKSCPYQCRIKFQCWLDFVIGFPDNTAHERFWEGRKLWGALVNTVRNLAQDNIVVKDKSPPDRVERKLMLVAFQSR